MAGIDDNVAIIGDWVPPSPSPRAFFSAMLGDDINSRTIPESPGEKRNEGLYLGQPEQMATGNSEKKDGAQTSGVQLTELGTFSEQKSNFRGGLVERIAARAGFNAPRLNTESIRSTESSMNPEIRSPYLTIPPGLSPTTLLESPVFLSNLVSFRILKFLHAVQLALGLQGRDCQDTFEKKKESEKIVASCNHLIIQVKSE
jgi:WRKY transcription factor 2